MTKLNQLIKARNWGLVRKLISSPSQINNDTLNYALNSGNIPVICDVIEAGAKPNNDSLACAALSAPVFLPTILNMLRAEGKDIKKLIVDKYGPIPNQVQSATSQELERISSLERAKFWRAVWSKKIDPTFHDKHVKSPLKTLVHLLKINPGEGIFVPFCGKSVDMLWLQRQGYHVIGVDISKEAIDAFCIENSLQYRESHQGNFIVREINAEKGSLKLLCGDIFKLQKSHVDGINTIYDRAGYIAIPKEMRVKYSKMLTNLFPEGTRMLLGLFDFSKEKSMTSPPYFIEEKEINELLSHKFEVHRFFENRQEFFAAQSTQMAENKPSTSLEQVSSPSSSCDEQKSR